MKTSLIALTLAAIALLLGACSTVDSRIKEKQTLFDSLGAVDQANIKQGIVGVGYTYDMVYMAMGKADKVQQRTTPTGTVTTWIYNQYYQEYVGTQFVGYSRNLYFDNVAKVWRVYYTPVSERIYKDRVEEIGRVIFRNDRVESIEQAQ